MIENTVRKVLNEMLPKIKDSFIATDKEYNEYYRADNKSESKSFNLLESQVIDTDDNGFYEIKEFPDRVISVMGVDGNLVIKNDNKLQSYRGEPDGMLFRGKSLVKSKGKIFILRTSLP